MARREYAPAKAARAADGPAPSDRTKAAARVLSKQRQALRDDMIPLREVEGQILAPPPDRLIVVIDVSTQSRSGEPKGARIAAQRTLGTRGAAPSDRDDVYVGEEGGVPLLAHTWVERPGFLVVHNVTGMSFQRQPTQALREELDKAVVLVEREGQDKPEAVIRPGLMFAGEIVDPQECTLRCLSGEARLRVVVTPQ